MAEVTSKSIQGLSTFPTGGSPVQLLFIKGTSAANNDTLTVSGLTTVQGAFLISTTGTVITMTFATNVVTLTNGSTLTVSGLCWGT
jgi:hypothetical protein